MPLRPAEPASRNATELPVGEIGEVVAASPHISPGYFRQPGADADNKIPDRTGGDTWHRLGDTGYLDADGRLWVCGRRSHRVVTPRGVLYPLCCEPVFNAHPGVERSALVGDTNAHGVTEAVLCVQLPAGRTPSDAIAADLLALARRHDATRLIDRVAFTLRIPVDRRHNAKIDRPVLAAKLSVTPR